MCFDKIKNLSTPEESFVFTHISVDEEINDNFSKFNYPNKILGNFGASSKKLTNLLGIPKIIKGHVWINENNLINLKYCPTYVGLNFVCKKNNLNTLKYAPIYVGKDFVCNENPDLTEEEILKYKKTGAVKGRIISDFGIF